jgi:hypothetical protein
MFTFGAGDVAVKIRPTTAFTRDVGTTTRPLTAAVTLICVPEATVEATSYLMPDSVNVAAAVDAPVTVYVTLFRSAESAPPLKANVASLSVATGAFENVTPAVSMVYVMVRPTEMNPAVRSVMERSETAWFGSPGKTFVTLAGAL